MLHHALTVRFRDCDMFQHVNNAVYLTYFEEARVRFWEELQGEPLVVNFILAEATCTYLSPAKLGETLDIAVSVADIGTKSFQLLYEVTERSSGRAIARGRTVQVMYDYEAGRSVSIDDALRSRLSEHLAQ